MGRGLTPELDRVGGSGLDFTRISVIWSSEMIFCITGEPSRSEPGKVLSA